MRTKNVNKIFLVIIACIVAYIFLLPLMFMIFTSFKGIAESVTSTTLLPKTWTMENYQELFRNTATSPVMRWLGNTAVVTCAGTVLRIVTSVLAAYALARLPLPGKKFILVALVWAMAIPEIVTFFPLFYMFKQIGGAEHLLAPDPAFGLRRHVYLPDLPVSAGVSQGAGGGRICGGSQCIPGAVAYCGAVGEAGYCHPGLYHLFRPVQQLSVAVPGHQQK